MGVDLHMNPIITWPTRNSQFSCCFCKDSCSVSPRKCWLKTQQQNVSFTGSPWIKKCLTLRDATTTRFAFQYNTSKYFSALFIISAEQECANTDMLSRGPMRGQLFRKAKVKSLRMTALIVAAFIVCWTPYYVVFIIFTFSEYTKLDQVCGTLYPFFSSLNVKTRLSGVEFCTEYYLYKRKLDKNKLSFIKTYQWTYLYKNKLTKKVHNIQMEKLQCTLGNLKVWVS